MGVGETDGGSGGRPSPGGEGGLIVTNSPVEGLPSVLLFEADGTSWYAQAASGEEDVVDALADYLAGILQGPCPDGPGEVPVQAGELCATRAVPGRYGGDVPRRCRSTSSPDSSVSDHSTGPR